ncbi:MAG: TetR/AcrR family transcriptional regulator [Sandaracinaceae bacterium]|nr:TetR/AcrR family transcriptional regulator [Sandaracinaceae bacterium]
MARPAEPEKRLELARRAVAVMQAEGVDIPMSRLADVLEVKRPSLLYHFPTRAHILETALEDLLTEQAMFVLARLAEHTHPIDRLFAQMRAVHAFHHGREARMLFLTQAIATSGGARMAEIIDVGNRVFEAHRRAAGELVRTGIHEGTVVPHDVDALMALVRAVTDGLMVQRVMTGLDLEPVHRLFWERVLRPLKRDPKEST